jgi:hypothetical protein
MKELMSDKLMPEFRSEIERMACTSDNVDVRVLARIVGLLLEEVENLATTKLDDPDYVAPDVINPGAYLPQAKDVSAFLRAAKPGRYTLSEAGRIAGLELTCATALLFGKLLRKESGRKFRDKELTVTRVSGSVVVVIKKLAAF